MIGGVIRKENFISVNLLTKAASYRYYVATFPPPDMEGGLRSIAAAR